MAVRFSVTSAATILHLCRHSAFVAPANLRYINVVNNNKKKKKEELKLLADEDTIARHVLLFNYCL